MPGNVTMRVPAAYTLPNDPQPMKCAERYAPQMSRGRPTVSRCRTTGPHAREYAMPVASTTTVTTIGHFRSRTRPASVTR